jgi:4-carboxymuconolactone decarboxylase
VKTWTALACGMVIGAALMLAIAIPRLQAGVADPGQPRFAQLTMEQLDNEQRPLGEKIMRVSSIGLSGPYNSMLRSPVMGDRLFMLLDYLRFNTSVPRRLNEFAILIQARLWTSQVEWRAHYPLALKAGLPPSVAADLAQGRRPAGMQPEEAAVYDLCMELSTKHEVSNAVFERAREIFSEQQLVDLVAVTGTYVTAAMFLKNAAEDGVPDGKVALLQPLALR